MNYLKKILNHYFLLYSFFLLGKLFSVFVTFISGGFFKSRNPKIFFLNLSFGLLVLNQS